jgi:hypothetical protein
VRYTVRPRHNSGHGAFSVAASQPREALDAAKAMTERGIRDVEVLDEDGMPYDLSALERAAQEHEAG